MLFLTTEVDLLNRSEVVPLTFQSRTQKNPEVEENICNLKTRIGTYHGLSTGAKSEELVTLAPYSESSRLAFFE